MSFLIGENMTCGYGGADILHSCTVGVEQGEIAVVVGPNGAGKSTAMKAMFGMLHLGEGRVMLDGTDISQLKPQERVLHGMGFAGALADIGLPQDNVPLALLFFNIGIEVGQIVFVLLAIGAGWLFKVALGTSLLNDRFTIRRKRLLLIPVYLLGGISAMWCIERGIEVLI